MVKLMHSLSVLLFLSLLCLAAGQLGTFFTTEESYHWFQLLNKPSWTPPNFIFPLIWTIAYLLMAVSAWLILDIKKNQYRITWLLWCIQLFLSALWTPLFFGCQEVFYGLIIISVIWLAVLTTTLFFFRL
jgi:benzodiazapine receptor